MTGATKKTIEIEDDLIIFVMKQSNQERRSFTGQLNQILRNEKNRTENKERKEKE
jgi:aspartate 1-decarboxylase